MVGEGETGEIVYTESNVQRDSVSLLISVARDRCEMSLAMSLSIRARYVCVYI